MKRLTVTAMARKYGGVLLAAALAFGQFSPTVYAAQPAAEENVVFDAEVPEEAAEAFSDAETFVEEAPADVCTEAEEYVGETPEGIVFAAEESVVEIPAVDASAAGATEEGPEEGTLSGEEEEDTPAGIGDATEWKLRIVYERQDPEGEFGDWYEIGEDTVLESTAEAPVTSYQIEDRDAGASAKPGYTFAGWYVDKGWNYKKNTQIYGSRVTKFALKDEVHLIAKWVPVR